MAARRGIHLAPFDELADPRRDGGVTIGPISTRSVAHATALSVTHGSAHPRTGGE